MSPDFWRAHLGLAGELVAANQPEEAMHEYAAVLKINPRHVAGRLNLGVSELCQKKTRFAGRFYQTRINKTFVKIGGRGGF